MVAKPVVSTTGPGKPAVRPRPRVPTPSASVVVSHPVRLGSKEAPRVPATQVPRNIREAFHPEPSRSGRRSAEQVFELSNRTGPDRPRVRGADPFGSDLISDRNLDEVILAYLEDRDSDDKK